jgi:hypothetical protein
MAKFSCIIPAKDWFFVFKGTQGKSVVNRIAVWAMNESGEVMGLIGGIDVRGNENTTQKLVSIPPVPGLYLHKDQLSPDELNSLNSR